MCVFLDDFSKHYNSRFEKYKSLCQSSIFKKVKGVGEKVDDRDILEIGEN